MLEFSFNSSDSDYGDIYYSEHNNDWRIGGNIFVVLFSDNVNPYDYPTFHDSPYWVSDWIMTYHLPAVQRLCIVMVWRAF